MPLYDMRCDTCGDTWERTSKTPPPPEPCRKCQGTYVRIYTAPARPIFKGSGFYTTDSRK